MPTYEYVCKKCGHEFEVVRSITAPPLKVCLRELCPHKKWGRGPVTQKITGGAGLLFKGSGFYATDYRSESYEKGVRKEASKPRSTTAKPVKK
jgi:putative FmdB family regulatory protein